MKRHTILALVIIFSVLVFPSPRGHGQEIFSDVQINSSPNPVGSGARAQGMGGAFIAVADDATAASWNPGGLMQLERPEFSIVGSYQYRRKDFSSSRHPEAEGMNGLTRYDLNYFSCAYPFRAFDKNMIISLNYQRLYDFYDELDFGYNFQGISSGGNVFRAETKTRFRQSGALKAFAPAFAVQVTPRLSVGITLNFWTNNLGYNNGWKNQRSVAGTGVLHTVSGKRYEYRYKSVTGEENDNFEGFNVNLGFLWQITKVITVGGVLKTPLNANADRDTYSWSQSYTLGKRPPPAPVPYKDSTTIHVRFPMSYGVGVAFRLSDAFTVDLDIYHTQWSDFYVKAHGSKTAITGDPKSEAHVHDTTQVRLGGEYLFILEKTLIPARFGLFYDPEPGRGHSKDYYGVTCGTGIMLGPVVLDCCYIYRWARDVEAEIPNARKDVDQHNILVSMIYHF